MAESSLGFIAASCRKSTPPPNPCTTIACHCDAADALPFRGAAALPDRHDADRSESPEMTGAFRVEVRDDLAGVAASDWNAMVGDDDPFVEHEFLTALERTGVVGADTPWQPRHLLAWDGDRLAGAIPFYVRWDSYGEFIFDFGWAEAYARAGLRYYPKGVAAVPFTPVTGTRILLAPGLSVGDGGRGDETAAAMIECLTGVAQALDLSGVHVLFPRQAEHDFLVARGFLSRVTHQYHWENRGYSSFDDWTADLRSKKRKQVLQERADVREQGIEIERIEGDAIRDEHVAAVWQFYLVTAERKWSQPYLVRETFEQLARSWKHRLLLVLAKKGGRYVAGTFNVRGARSLFGRYWGAIGRFPSLHFECCYWQLIDYAIENRLDLVEAGAQGEHKFLRGFNARPTWSAHWIAHPGGERAIADFLARERQQNEAVIDGYNRSSPVKSERSRF
jgi:predicted N-acyltransferase